MTQHNLQPNKPVAYDPHTANTIHPGHWLTASVFSALIRLRKVLLTKVYSIYAIALCNEVFVIVVVVAVKDP